MAHIPHIEALAPGSTGNQRPEALIRKLVMMIIRMIKLMMMVIRMIKLVMTIKMVKLVTMMIKLVTMMIKLVKMMIKCQST